jgi:flagellar hook-length control protein FliK
MTVLPSSHSLSTPPVESTITTPAGDTGKKSSDPQTSEGASSEVTGSSGRTAGWNVAYEESQFNDLAGSVLRSAAFGEQLTNVSERLAIQDLAENFSDAIVSGDVQTSTIETRAASDEQLFLVNEFTVETTLASAVSKSSLDDVSMSSAPSNQNSTIEGQTTATNSAQRPDQSADRVTTDAEIAMTSPANTSIARQEAPLAGEVANVVTRQLAEESTTGVTTVRIQLDRQDLGSVSLFLSTNNKIVSVRIVVQDELARQLVDSQMDELRQSLSESGVECSEFQVVCDSSHKQFSGRRRSPQTLIALAVSSTSRKLRIEDEAVKQELTTGKFNFTA